MNTKHIAVAAALALAVCAPLAGCGSTQSDGTSTSQQGSATSSAAADEDVVTFFVGRWRASVETSGSTVYGNVTGKEKMLDVLLNEDGTCSIEPLEGHEDLLTEEGTWSADGTDEVVLEFPSGTTMLTVVDDTTLQGDPVFYGIEGFDSLEFVLY